MHYGKYLYIFVFVNQNLNKMSEKEPKIFKVTIVIDGRDYDFYEIAITAFSAVEQVTIRHKDLFFAEVSCVRVFHLSDSQLPDLMPF